MAQRWALLHAQALQGRDSPSLLLLRVWGQPVLLEREHSKQKGIPIFWCTASLGTFPALASHSLICPGIAHLPLTPKSVLPRLCLQLSCCQAVSDEKCEYIHVCCWQAENSSVGAFPKTNPGYDDAIDCSLHFSPTLSLNRNKKYKAEHSFPP